MSVDNSQVPEGGEGMGITPLKRESCSARLLDIRSLRC